jgi:hypothetical protein
VYSQRAIADRVDYLAVHMSDIERAAVLKSPAQLPIRRLDGTVDEQNWRACRARTLP